MKLKCILLMLQDYFKNPALNPFKKPNDENIFLYREKEHFVKERVSTSTKFNGKLNARSFYLQ